MKYKLIEFPSQDATIRGRFYFPEDKSEPYAVVVMAHGFSATISMVADNYATEFCKSGFAVLLYDHLNFGISDGVPRQEINKWLQARGYMDAINYLSSLSYVDKNNIALWGDSMSGAEVLLVGAVDNRIKAIIAQIPACGDSPPPFDEDGSLCKSMINYFLHGDVRGRPETTIGPIPVVSCDQKGTPSLLQPLTSFRWFIEYGGRYNTRWENTATYVNPNADSIFHPGLCARDIKPAVLMMIATDDEMEGANSNISRQVYDAIPSPKQLIEMEGGHFGLLYYPGKLFDKASEAQCRFLSRILQS